MNLIKALKTKKKLIKQINTTYSRLSESNSVTVDTVRTYSPEDSYNKWIRLTNELIDLKTKIQLANAPIASKIFRLGELKSMVSSFKHLSTVEGKITVRYSPESVEYIAYINTLQRDQIIEKWEEEIEQLQEEIEAFNAVTKIK